MTLTATQIADGWKPHDGGECPVQIGHKVGVMLRASFRGITIVKDAQNFDWGHTGDDFDIIAYKEQSHADGE